MDKLLRAHTRINVSQIAEGDVLEPNHIHLIPPGPFLEIRDGRFHLVDLAREEWVRTPIDRFFTSLADACGRDAFAIILSGTGSDGTLGIRSIKMNGGVALVQQSASARFPGMPDSAAATGLVDFELPPDAMPSRILDILDHRQHLQGDDSAPDLFDDISARLPDILKALDPDGQNTFGKYTPHPRTPDPAADDPSAAILRSGVCRQAGTGTRQARDPEEGFPDRRDRILPRPRRLYRGGAQGHRTDHRGGR